MDSETAAWLREELSQLALIGDAVSAKNRTRSVYIGGSYAIHTWLSEHCPEHGEPAWVVNDIDIVCLGYDFDDVGAIVERFVDLSPLWHWHTGLPEFKTHRVSYKCGGGVPRLEFVPKPKPKSIDELFAEADLNICKILLRFDAAAAADHCRSTWVLGEGVECDLLHGVARATHHVPLECHRREKYAARGFQILP